MMAFRIFGLRLLAILLLLLAGCGRMITAATDMLPGGEVEEGRQLFSLSCAKCHGRNGEGDGPEHSSLRPPPTNLSLIGNTPEMNYSIVARGVPGTSMTAHPYIPRQVFARVAAFLATIPADTNQEWGYPWELTEAAAADAAYGGKIYATACAGCHGLAGDGRGSWADDPRIRPKPADFRGRNSVPGRLYYLITHGRPGTMMPPQQEVLPARTRWALAAYVHSLYDPRSKAEIPREESGAAEGPGSGGSSARGEELYQLYCAACHGASGKGSFLAPRLIDRCWLYGSGTDAELLTVIDKGIPGKLMPSFAALTKDDKAHVIAYVRSRGGLRHPLAKSH